MGTLIGVVNHIHRIARCSAVSGIVNRDCAFILSVNVQLYRHRPHRYNERAQERDKFVAPSPLDENPLCIDLQDLGLKA